MLSRWRIAGLLFSLALSAWAAPPLSTIQDTLFRADGTRFQGTARIEWQTFQASDGSTISGQSLVVPIVNGTIRVSLVPTANALSVVSYLVKYEAAGRTQFTERWTVPATSTLLRLRDVRTLNGGSTPPPPVLTQVQITDVLGLTDELTVRPLKAPGFAGNRAVVATATGALSAASGNPGDCVRVDGSTGPCGSTVVTAGPSFVDAEVPSGLLNGTNAVFTLVNAPEPASSLHVYRNGVRQREGIDYAVAGNTVTFAVESLPQPADLLQVSYRRGGSGAPAELAGGVLTGSYPNPTLNDGVLANRHVAVDAGIAESKLSLTFPTHSNANDPTPSEKAALTGSAGVPSGSNRFVTDQDPRLTSARAPLGHALLGASHSDTAGGSPARGDLIVGAGGTALWTRLPLGAANRCLMSNGADAVWNTCLYTAFPVGSLPFVDAAGNLAQNQARLAWDNSNRRLSVGTAQSLTTLFLHDATPAVGTTGLTIRAGQAQGGQPLQVWQGGDGATQASVQENGHVTASSVEATAANRASWREAGLDANPASFRDGDAWLHRPTRAQRAVAGMRVHAVPQVLCGATGGVATDAVPQVLGSCTIPEGMLNAGDRLEVQFDAEQSGGSASTSVELRWAGSSIGAVALSAGDALVSARATAGVHAGGSRWHLQAWGAGPMVAAPQSLPSGPGTLEWIGQVVDGAGSVTLRQFTVVRLPAIANP